MLDNMKLKAEALLGEVDNNLYLARQMEAEGKEKIGECLRWIAADQLNQFDKLRGVLDALTGDDQPMLVEDPIFQGKLLEDPFFQGKKEEE